MFRGLFKFVVGEDPESQREEEERGQEAVAAAETTTQEEEERIDVVGGDMDSKADTTPNGTATTPTRPQQQVVELVRKTTEESEARAKALQAKEVSADPVQVLVGDDGKALQFFVPQDMQFSAELKALVMVRPFLKFLAHFILTLKAGGMNFSPIFNGCPFQPLLPKALPSSCHLDTFPLIPFVSRLHDSLALLGWFFAKGERRKSSKNVCLISHLL